MSAAEEHADGLWEALHARIEATGTGDDGGLWDVLAGRADVGEFRPKLADDVEIKEFHLRWGNDYAMVANPRDLIHYELTPNQIALMRLMDGSRTVKEIVLEGLKGSEALELSGVADLVEQLYVGDFLETRFVDSDEAVQRAIKPQTRTREKLQGFAKTLSVDWETADRPIRWAYNHGLKVFFGPVAMALSVVPVVVGLVAFFIVAGQHRYNIGSATSFALGLILLTVLNYFLTFVHESGHALALVHYGRRVKSAGFMIYFGSPSFFIESADGLMMERRQRMVQAFAGGYAEMIFCGIAAILLWAFPGGPLAAILYRFAVLGYLVIFLNWIPLLELDGYFIVADLIQVPDLRPRSMAFVRHDFWHKLRRRQRFTVQEVGLLLYGILGAIFTVIVLYLSFFFWQGIFGSIFSKLWHGGFVSRVVLLLLILLIVGPLVRGVIQLLRAVGRRAAAVWRSVRFRLERGWRIEAARLIDALPLFDDVPAEVLSELAGRVRMRSLARGQPVVRQGERAQSFYVVRSGALEIVEEDPGSGNERVLRVLGRGEGFGELGLLEAAPRTATVRALDEAQVFEIDKGAFEQLLADMAHVPHFEPTLQAMNELGELPVFANLEPDERSELLQHGAWVNIAPGDTVIEQGEVGDAFYAIHAGQVDVFEDGAKVRTMGPGSYFGEIALLLDTPRTATVVARTPVRAYRLGREGFDRLVREAFAQGTLNPAISPDRVWQH
jgi:putative peptide zinc metalloprotease protein